VFLRESTVLQRMRWSRDVATLILGIVLSAQLERQVGGRNSLPEYHGGLLSPSGPEAHLQSRMVATG